MKIESFKINVAVADGAKREWVANAMRTAATGSSVVLGIEIEGEAHRRLIYAMAWGSDVA